jgi:predicted AlkP superfamily phosphohydrolase/phosphomutase
MMPPGRTWASAALAAAIFAGDLVLLTLFLNADVSLRVEAPALFLALFMPYTLGVTAALWLAAALASAVPAFPRVVRAPIEPLPWFTALGFLATAAGAALFWLNLLNYRHSVPLVVLGPLAGGAIALTTAALVLLAVGVDALLFPARGRGVSALVVVLAAASAIVLPLALRPGPAPAPAPVPFATERVTPARRLVVVGIDGLGMDLVNEAVARGSLPAFAQILRKGAHGRLATLRPTEAPPIWTTIFTGRLPRDHGVKSFGTYRLRGSATRYDLLPKGALVGLLEKAGLVSTSPVTSASRRRRALWNVLNAFGIPAGTARVWGTHPPERIQAFVISPYLHVLRKDPAQAAETVHPRAMAPEVLARAVDPADVDRALLAEFIDFTVEVPGDEVPWRRELLERALAPDLTYQRAGSVLRAAYDPPLFATYFFGMDVIGHTFTRFDQPDRFGDVRPEERRRYGGVVQGYAAYVARAVGELAQGLRPGEILLVVSGSGMEPVPHWRRAWEAMVGGDRWISGTHADAPDGLLLAVGDGIRPGATLRSASVLDLAPTMLYLMGLPVARDMEGRILAEILQDDFTRAHPLTFIPSYESLAVTPTTGDVLPGLPPLPDESP